MPAPTVAWVSTPAKGAGSVTPTYGGPVQAGDVLLALAETWTNPTTDIFDPAAGSSVAGSQARPGAHDNGPDPWGRSGPSRYRL
jgi:hypothetical protein